MGFILDLRIDWGGKVMPRLPGDKNRTAREKRDKAVNDAKIKAFKAKLKAKDAKIKEKDARLKELSERL